MIAMEENGELAIAAVEKIDDLDILNTLFEDRSIHKSGRVRSTETSWMPSPLTITLTGKNNEERNSSNFAGRSKHLWKSRTLMKPSMRSKKPSPSRKISPRMHRSRREAPAAVRTVLQSHFRPKGTDRKTNGRTIGTGESARERRRPTHGSLRESRTAFRRQHRRSTGRSPSRMAKAWTGYERAGQDSGETFRGSLGESSEPPRGVGRMACARDQPRVIDRRGPSNSLESPDIRTRQTSTGHQQTLDRARPFDTSTWT